MIRFWFLFVYTQITSMFCCFALLVISSLFVILPTGTLADDMDISPSPLKATIKTPPPAVMFLLDDSWSMDSEVLTDEEDGYFHGKVYLFMDAKGKNRDGLVDSTPYLPDNNGDNRHDQINVFPLLYESNYYPEDKELRDWKSQCYTHNKIYYNPNVDYSPWPSAPGYTFEDASTSTPKYDPRYEGSISLTDNFHGDDWPNSTTIGQINNAHYYLEDPSTGNVYLVNFTDSGDRAVYLFTDDLNDRQERRNEDADDDGDNGTVGVVDNNELSTSSLPSSIELPENLTAAQDLQNFANWFQYYRKRYMVSLAAVARTVNNLSGVYVGFYSINQTAIQSVLQIKVIPDDDTTDDDTTEVDETPIFLTSLYNELMFRPDDEHGATYLRENLVVVGEYFLEDGEAPDSNLGSFEFHTDGAGCQRTFTLLMTDGYWTENVDPCDPDTRPCETMTEIQNWSLSAYYDGNTDPDGDGYHNTLADVAMAYYQMDLSDAADLMPIKESDCDKKINQHMVTFAVSFGVKGDMDPEAYDTCGDTVVEKGTDTEAEWGNPFCGVQGCYKKAKIDDLWHATANSKGLFFNASNPEDLVESLEKIFDAIDGEANTAAAITVENERIYKSGTYYQSSYDSETWTGSVAAVTLNYDPSTTYDPLRIGKTQWLVSGAADANNDLIPAPDNRVIITYNEESEETISFRWGDLSTTQKEAILDIDIPYSPNDHDTDGDLRINCLRGDDSGGIYRQVPKLGDIVHSSPVPVNGVIYVGANDGKLHAFNGDSGEEIFAYVPNLVFENLKDLLATDYSHSYYVDQTPVWSRVKKDLSLTTNEEEGFGYYLVGGLNAGGKGYYCLDITGITTTNTPDLSDLISPPTEDNLNNKKGVVQWEFPGPESPDGEVLYAPDMGFSFSTPIIARTTVEDHPYVVIFGNGYNSQNGHAVLFVLDLFTGNVLKKFDTEVGSPEDKNGMSSPRATDVDNDNCVEYVYAGDLKGNMWKFNVSSNEIDDWNFSFRSEKNNTASPPHALFTTLDNQPITTQPAVMLSCSGSGYMVLFGTGKFLGNTDIPNTDQQAIYGIWDYGDSTDLGEYIGGIDSNDYSIKENGDLHIWVPETIEQDDENSEIFLIESISSNTHINWHTQLDSHEGFTTQWSTNDKKPNPQEYVGWMIPFQNSGERVIQDVKLQSECDKLWLSVFSIFPRDVYCEKGITTLEYSLNPCNGSITDETIIHTNPPLPPIEGGNTVIYDDNTDDNDTPDHPVRVIRYKRLFFWNETGS